MSGGQSDDKSRKTEQPTPHKLRQAREKGSVAKSKDIVSTVNIVVMFAYIWIMWDYFWSLTEELIITSFRLIEQDFIVALKYLTTQVLVMLMLILLPAVILSATSVIMASVMQFGLIIAPEKIKLDPNNINPINGFKKIFSLKNFVEMLKSILKISVFSLTIGIVYYLYINDVLNAVHCGIICELELAYQMAAFISVSAILLFVAIAIFDMWYQKYEFNKEQMMTKEELTRDRKDTHGDPMIKNRRNETQREMAKVDFSQSVKDSTLLLVTNNMAIGLKYKAGETPLPIIMFKEQKQMANRMKELAKMNEKPIIEDNNLTAELWKKGKVDQYIPKELIDPIAKVFVGVLSK